MENSLEIFEVSWVGFEFSLYQKIMSQDCPENSLSFIKILSSIQASSTFQINLQKKSIHNFPLNKTLPINFLKSDLHAELQLKTSD